MSKCQVCHLYFLDVFLFCKCVFSFVIKDITLCLIRMKVLFVSLSVFKVDSGESGRNDEYDFPEK